MSGIWPPATLPGLHIDMGDYTRPWTPRRGTWLRLPAADYLCGGCGWTAHASAAGVLTITETITDHQCPTNPKGSTS